MTDRDLFALLPCVAVLTIPGESQWEPIFATPREIRKSRPEVADLPGCSTAKVGKIDPGTVINMAETFQIPWQEFERAQLRLSLPSERPRYLLFSR